MESRVKKYRQLSPERAKVWTERSPKYQQVLPRVPVVYYLCRNRQLEHPHFIEVPLSSPDGLYLRDVIARLNALRGRGMASMYSWSCKRSYKNGFVWHDLGEDDIIFPAHGNEYILKASELFEECNSGLASPAANQLQNQKQLPEPVLLRSHDDSSSSSSMTGRDIKHSQDDELSPPIQHPGSSGVSPQSSDGKNFPLNGCPSLTDSEVYKGDGIKDGNVSSLNGCLSLTEYKICKNNGMADASTQTEENSRRINKAQETCTRGVSTDEGLLEIDNSGSCQNQVSHMKEMSDISRNLISPPPSSSNYSLSHVKTETLGSLMRADACNINSFRILEEEELRMPSYTKLKASDLLIHLLSCGSIAVKDHRFGVIPTYRPEFSHSKSPSPLFSTSFVLGELDCLTENPRFRGLRLEDKEYFSGTLVETNMLKEEGHGFSALKRSSSSSCDVDRNHKQLGSSADNEETTSRHSKCIPRSIKASFSKHPRSESMRSPLSEGPRVSFDGVDSSRTMVPHIPNDSSRRIMEPSSGKNQTTNLDSFGEDKSKFVKIEESLLQGLEL